MSHTQSQFQVLVVTALIVAMSRGRWVDGWKFELKCTKTLFPCKLMRATRRFRLSGDLGHPLSVFLYLNVDQQIVIHSAE